MAKILENGDRFVTHKTCEEHRATVYKERRQEDQSKRIQSRWIIALVWGAFFAILIKCVDFAFEAKSIAAVHSVQIERIEETSDKLLQNLHGMESRLREVILEEAHR